MHPKSQRPLTAIEIDLRERIKELEGLYALNHLATLDIPIEELFTRFTQDIIPKSMQFPEYVFSKIVLDGVTHTQCANISQQTDNVLKRDIVINNLTRGNIFIGYIDPALEFLETFENKLIQGYADKLADIIQRKESDAQLLLEKARAEHYLRIAGVIIIALDIEGVVTLINETGCRIVGRPQDQIIGINWFDHFTDPRDRDNRKLNHLRMTAGLSEPLKTIENRILNRDGEQRIISWHVTLVRDQDRRITGTLSSGEDITRRVFMENKKIEAEKIAERSLRLASMGTMAGGIAHEINQPLTALKSKADGLLLWREMEHEVRIDELWDALRFISGQSQRIHDIIQHLRSLINQRPIHVYEEFNLHRSIESTLALVRTKCQAQQIRLVTDYDPSITFIRSNHVLLMQAILNLINNALEALSVTQYNDKTITIRTKQVPNNLTIEIEDNGTGVTPEIMDHIFDPFFTTKNPQKGMGLGLTITENFIRSLGGVINLRNAPDRGAISQIKLPNLQKKNRDYLFGNEK